MSDPDKSPRASIIMRTRDRSLFLSRALADVAAQTEHEWELVIVNDGGDADAVDRVVRESPLRSDARVRVIHLASSTGMEAASNVGLAATSGAFVAVHDDDDTWATDFLDATCGWLDAHPASDAVVTATDMVIERVDDGAVTEIERQPWRPPHEMVSLFDLLMVNRFVPIATVVRRTALQRLGGFDEDFPVVGDWALHLRLAQQGEIGYIGDQPRAFWHRRPESSGAEGNSVFRAHLEHLQFDRRVRDDALRSYVEREGLGLPLLLTRFVDERVRELVDERLAAHVQPLVRRLESLQAQLAEHGTVIRADVQRFSPGATIARNLKRLLRRPS